MKEPKIRFKGFQGEWEETTLANVGKCFSGIGFPETEQGRKKGIPFYKVSDMNNIGNEKVLSNSNNYVTEEQVNKNGWKVCNDVPAIYFAKVGAAVLLNRKRLVLKPCLCDNNTMLYSFDKKVWDTYFCQSYFETIDLASLVQVGSLPSYNASMVGEVNVSLPDIDEQKALGAYFQHLDSLIQSTTKEIESLKQVKAASLQSMFPQEGETTPRVRFKGFEGEWEKVRASNVFKTFNEKNRPDLPVLSATQDRGMVTRESIGYNIFHDKSNEATYKHILPGQFIIHLRSFQGGFAHSSIEGIASPAYTIMEFKDKTRHFDLYWKYIFVSKEFIKRLELITYGIRDGRSISFEEFSEMYFTVPSYEEQKKIASYITTLDRQITLQIQRLEKLKQIKAACLDKMFV